MDPEYSFKNTVDLLNEIDLTKDYLNLIRDKDGQVFEYEMIFWVPDQRSFRVVNGDPYVAISEIHNSFSKTMPAGVFEDRNENGQLIYDYYVGENDADFKNMISFLKDPERFDFIGKVTSDVLFEYCLPSLNADILSERNYGYNYAFLPGYETAIVRPDDALCRVYELELKLPSGEMWFVDHSESDENGNTVCCTTDENGKTFWLSNNIHASNSLLCELESVWKGEVKPVYINHATLKILDQIAENYEWEKPNKASCVPGIQNLADSVSISGFDPSVFDENNVKTDR